MDDFTRAQHKNAAAKVLEQTLKNNQHTLVAMTSEEFVDFAISQKMATGMTIEQINEWLDDLIVAAPNIPDHVKQSWTRNKNSIKNKGSYLPVLGDVKILAVLAYDMKKGGRMFSKYRINTYAGKSYIVFNGYPGLRTHLTGTRYLISNPKVVSMGVGKLGAANAIKGGVIISVIFTVAFHAIEQVLNDRATWHDFVAGISVDVVSAITGGAIAWGAVSAFVGGTAMAAVGPIALVVLVGAGVTYALGAISDHYRITERLAKMLNESESRMRESYRSVKNEIRRGLNYADEDPLGFMHRLFGLPYFPTSFR